MAMLLQGKETPFDTELFSPIMKKLEELQKVDNIESRRIIAEHLRSSMMLIADGGRPSNIDRGYILRRLIRRMIRHLNKLQIDLNELSTLIEINVENLKEMYPELEKNKESMVMGIGISNQEALRRLNAYKKRAGWQSLNAISNNRLYGLYMGASRTLADAAMIEYIAKALYPTLFEDIDPIQTYIDYHKKYLPIVPEGTFGIRASQ